MMNNQPLVSVIMNCFNGECYLSDSIKSILAQTYKNIEIIFWDNQSTDNSASIVKSFNDSRIQYFFSEKHTSLGSARNKALKKTNGELVSFLDCDDLMFPRRIEKMVSFFDNTETGMVYTNGFALFESNGCKKIFYKRPQSSGYMFEKWIASYNVMIPSVMFRMSVVKDNNIVFNDKFSMVEEYDFFLRIAKYSYVQYCHRELAIWRVHSNSLTWKKSNEWAVELELMLQSLKSDKSLNVNKECLNKLQARVVYRKFLNYMHHDSSKARKILIRSVKNDIRLLIFYFLSFLGNKNLRRILKKLGKSY